jgi:hypothetical protein
LKKNLNTKFKIKKKKLKKKNLKKN